MNEQWQNPERVEPGQVWDARGWLRYAPGDDLLVVHRLRAPSSGPIASFGKGLEADEELMLRAWHCVGYELNDGRRVMVGDRFGCAWIGALTVLSVRHGDRFAIRADEDGSTGEVGARFLLDSYQKLADLAEAKWAFQDAQAAFHGVDAERWRREAPRREIDRLLAEDARLHPPFAMARRAAVMAAFEGQRNLHQGATPEILAWLRLYEDARGIRRLPLAGADDEAKAWGRRNASMCAAWCALDVYERARGER